MKAYCPFANKYFVFSIKDGKATDFAPIEKEKYDKLVSTVEVTETAKNLLPNKYDNSRRIASSELVKSRQYPQCKNAKYDFQCAYCSNLKVEGVGGKSKSIEECEILVSTPHYDDIGAVVTLMRLNHKKYLNNLDTCDIFFLNCGTNDFVDSNKLRKFVENGGILYASDWAVTYIQNAFPDFITSCNKDTNSCYANARVVDYEMQQMTKYIKIYFDLGAWVKVTKHTGTTLMDTTDFGGITPIMMMKKYGKGTVFYTSFHNHAVATEEERDLLKLLICKQLAAKTGKSINDINALLGLNFKL